MPLDVKQIVDRCMRLEKTLCRRDALEALLLALAPSGYELRILCPVVVAQPAWSMSVSQFQAFQRRGVGAQTIGDDGFWYDVLIAQQPHGRSCVALLMRRHVHDLAFIVGRSRSRRICRR